MGRDGKWKKAKWFFKIFTFLGCGVLLFWGQTKRREDEGSCHLGWVFFSRFFLYLWRYHLSIYIFFFFFAFFPQKPFNHRVLFLAEDESFAERDERKSHSNDFPRLFLFGYYLLSFSVTVLKSDAHCITLISFFFLFLKKKNEKKCNFHFIIL